MNNIFFSNDPQISSIVEDLVESVAKIEVAAPILIAKLVPYLQTALATKEDVLESNGDTSVTNTFISTCLDITTRLVRYLPKPIPLDVIKTLYPITIEKTLQSNDTQIIQSGGETVRGFFASAGDQICQMEGGLSAAEKVILHLLAPDQPEFSASFAGRLVTLIVLKTQGRRVFFFSSVFEIVFRRKYSKYFVCGFGEAEYSFNADSSTVSIVGFRTTCNCRSSWFDFFPGGSTSNSTLAPAVVGQAGRHVWRL